MMPVLKRRMGRIHPKKAKKTGLKQSKKGALKSVVKPALKRSLYASRDVGLDNPGSPHRQKKRWTKNKYSKE